jgi:hypothetical protein
MSLTKRGGSNVTIIVQDENWNKMATFKWNTADKKKQHYVTKTLDDAFGIKLNKQSDLDWVRD